MFMIIYSPYCLIQLVFLPQIFVLNWDVGSTNVQVYISKQNVQHAMYSSNNIQYVCTRS